MAFVMAGETLCFWTSFTWEEVVNFFVFFVLSTVSQ
jgi:hypothetical protein